MLYWILQIENMVFAVRIVGYVQTSTAFAFYVWTFPLETMQIYPISLWDYSLFGSLAVKTGDYLQTSAAFAF